MQTSVYDMARTVLDALPSDPRGSIAAGIPVCERCGGSGWLSLGVGQVAGVGVTNSPVPCVACRLPSLLVAAGVPKQYLGHDGRVRPFESEYLADTSCLRQMQRYVKALPEMIDNGRGFYLYGENGSGKTHLAAKLVSYVLENRAAERAYTARFVTVYDFLDGIKERFGSSRIAKDENAIRWQRNITDVDFLVFDDLGAELARDWSAAVLFDIINDRTNKRRPLVITSNYSPEQLANELVRRGIEQIQVSRLFSRITGLCLSLEVVSSGDQRAEFRD